MTTRRKRGYTLVELVLVGAVVVVLLVILMPYIARLREGSQRAACAANLFRARDGLTSYAAENGNLYPRTVFGGTNGYTAYTGATDADPFNPGPGDQVEPNDVTASLWLLQRGSHVPNPSVFVCPSTWDTPDPLELAAKLRGNFRGPQHLSYSYANPFSTMSNYRLDDVLTSEFALLADMAPATPAPGGVVAVPFDAAPLDLADVNSPNHGGAGQNVLFADGSVRWTTTPYVGVGNREPGQPAGAGGAGGAGTGLGDNIYSALAPEPLQQGQQPAPNSPGVVGRAIGPSYQYDAYLVPDVSAGSE